MASTDARPLPIKNTAYRLTFPIYKNDGTLITGATALDSEVSKDAGTFADCTNEATEIATSSGVYYLDLTSTEMNADCVAVVVKTSSTGAAPPVFVLYPQEAGDVKVDVETFGGTAGTFASGRPEVNASHIAGSAVSTSTAQIGVNVVNAAGTAWGSGAITAASIATDALTAAKFAADVTTELQSGLATAAALATVDGIVDNLVSGIIFGAAATGTLSTTVATTNLTGYANDQLIGRVVIWLSGNAEGEASTITDYASTNGTLTFDALTTAPGNGDTFKIV